MNNDHKSFAVELAYKAGEIMRANFSGNMKKEWKADNSPVTETDFAINKLLLDAVRKTFPDYSLLAEEESNIKDNAEYTWVCDPLDGTIPFSHGVPTCAFSLALVKNGKSILGVTYDPFQDRMFTAELGKGAFLNKKRIHVSSTKNLNRAIVQAFLYKGSSYYMKNVPDAVTQKGARCLNLASIVYGGSLVAAGEFTAAIYSGHMAHDIAALKILVDEAGGKVTNLFGVDQRYDGEVKGGLITNGFLHQELLQLIKENAVFKTNN